MISQVSKKSVIFNIRLIKHIKNTYVHSNEKVNSPDHSLPVQIDNRNSELNTCCFIMYVKCHGISGS